MVPKPNHADSSVFETIQRERNGVAAIHSAFGDFPAGVAAHYEFYKQLVLKDSLPLTRAEREFLAWKTSEANECPYCIGHHYAAFQGASSSSIEPAKANALERLALSLTKEMWKANALKPMFLDSGFSEPEWQHAIMVVAYFNFANRCAHAMNLQLEENFQSTCE